MHTTKQLRLRIYVLYNLPLWNFCPPEEYSRIYNLDFSILQIGLTSICNRSGRSPSCLIAHQSSNSIGERGNRRESIHVVLRISNFMGIDLHKKQKRGSLSGACYYGPQNRYI